LVGTFKDAFKDDRKYSYEHLTIFEPILDDEGIRTSEELSQILLEKSYDIALVSMHHNVIVPLETAKKIGKKLFLIFYDTHMSALTSDRTTNFRMFVKKTSSPHVNYQHTIYEYSQYCNCLITDYGHGEEMSNIYGVITPQIDSLMKPLHLEKIYDISFTGSPYTNERKSFIKYINSNGYKVNLFGGRRTNDPYLSVEDYAIKINQSKINLNFNHSNIQPHRVGRAYEIAACGGFMLSTFPEVYKSKNGSHLVDGQHFISFTQFDILDKIKYYLENDYERNVISNNIRNQYVSNFTARKWWDNIFNMVNDK
jgi:hypothetical protein